jgi:two-component system sensor histidine kinase BaeS
MLAVVVVTIGLSGVFTRRVTHQEIQRLAVARPRLEGRLPRVILTDAQRNIVMVPEDLKGATVTVDANNRIVIARPGMRMILHVEPVRTPSGLAYPVPQQKIQLAEIAAFDRRLIYTFAGATLVAILLTLLLSRHLTKPIERLNAAVNEMKPVQIAGSDETAQLAHSFNAMLQKIETQQDLRRRMVGDVAHELRTPLTNLRCELEAIQDGLKTADTGSMLEDVLHLSRIVEDLQELAVAEAGVVSLNLSSIALGDLVARVVDSFGASPISIAINVDNSIVTADPGRVGQIVRNLLSNAVRHASSKVDVAVREGVITVADDGPGIPEKDLPHIFERFYRVDDARSRATGGVGLGSRSCSSS